MDARLTFMLHREADTPVRGTGLPAREAPATGDAATPPAIWTPLAGQPIRVVLNPTAGGRRRRTLERLLVAAADRIGPVELTMTEGAGDGERLAREAPADAGAVVSAGGDGTFNEVLNGLMQRPGPPLPLGLLPLGTANVLARELGVPLDLEAAVAVLGRARLGALHPARFTGQRHAGRSFAVMLGAGFDGRIVARLPSRLKRHVGKSAYAVEVLRELATLPGHDYRVTIDGAIVRAGSVVVTKSRYYGGGFVLAPEARATAPGLHVCLFEQPGRRAHARYLLATLAGRIGRQPDFRVVPARRVVIEGPTGEPVQADGEVVGALPVTVTDPHEPWPIILPE